MYHKTKSPEHFCSGLLSLSVNRPLIRFWFYPWEDITILLTNKGCNTSKVIRDRWYVLPGFHWRLFTA
jgi:hypothetical protein